MKISNAKGFERKWLKERQRRSNLRIKEKKNETIELIYKVFINKIPRIRSEKAMAPHFSTLAWKIPWMEEPGRLQSMGSLRFGYD